LFRKTGLSKTLIEAYPDFVFSYKGALAYVGASRGIADLKNLWDIYPVGNQVKVEGTSAFAIWRSLYFSKLLSSRNQAQVAFDWIKSWLFGRDIATPATTTTDDRRSELKDTKK
jgi:NADH dehydrogenase FAD-containing subunit